MVIGYGMIIGQDLIIKLGLIANFKRNVVQWDDDLVPMKPLVYLSLGTENLSI